MLTEAAREQMVEQQVRAWDVLDERILDALRAVPRERFVPERWRELSFADSDIPLPCGKRMLRPMLVGRLLQALERARRRAGARDRHRLGLCLSLPGPAGRPGANHRAAPGARRTARARTFRASAAGRPCEVVTGDGLELDETQPLRRHRADRIAADLPTAIRTRTAPGRPAVRRGGRQRAAARHAWSAAP